MSRHKGNAQNSNTNNSSNNTTKNKAPKSHVVTKEPETTKLDYAVANHLRNNLPNKEAMFIGIKRVNYFIGSKAVNLLMESKWATGSDALFKTRLDAVIFLNELLLKKFYHRSRKIVKIDGTKKRYKLDMHDIQMFEDSNEPYIWLYEPTSLKAWLLCFGVIFGVIAICLFPLWPPIIRTWVYYLCIAGLALLSSILGLAVIRHIIFFALWTVTFGKLHFWILPNLTEDVGFFESFWPLYTIEKGGVSGEGVGEGGDGGQGVASSTSVGDAGIASHSHQD